MCGESCKHGSEGAVGIVPKGNSLAAYPTMEQNTKHVEGRFYRQETAPTYPNHFAARSAFPARV